MDAFQRDDFDPAGFVDAVIASAAGGPAGGRAPLGSPPPAGGGGGGAGERPSLDTAISTALIRLQLLAAE
jgi:hypothetical protein